jgi:hypothetical protein
MASFDPRGTGSTGKMNTLRYDTLTDVFTANDMVRNQFIETMVDISDIEAQTRLDDEKWSISQIVEHLALVDQGIARICGKLLSEAKNAGQMSDGTISISSDFWQRAAQIAEEKVEAPLQVQPTGGTTVSDSVEELCDNVKTFEKMRSDLEVYDLTIPKFPHPYFGPINAVEWLVVAGEHERRHTQQIKRLLTRIRGEKNPG